MNKRRRLIIASRPGVDVRQLQRAIPVQIRVHRRTRRTYRNQLARFSLAPRLPFQPPRQQ